jgi:hypothetical protein
MVSQRTSFTFHPCGAHTVNSDPNVVTLTRPAGSAGILIQNTGTTTNNIFYVLDESTPASGTGFLLAPVVDGGDVVRVDFRNNDFKYHAAADAVLQYQWFD